MSLSDQHHHVEPPNGKNEFDYVAPIFGNADVGNQVSHDTVSHHQTLSSLLLCSFGSYQALEYHHIPHHHGN